MTGTGKKVEFVETKVKKSNQRNIEEIRNNI